tara:strand:- start:2631 stop:3062 length:432 start_codon:yes stop_codon:yes gene_type:complete
MIDLVTSILPIGLGFIAKLIAIKSKASSDNQKLMIEQMNANAQSTNAAREFSKSESPYAALNRRFIIIVILGLIVFLQVAPVFFDIPTAIKVTQEGWSLFGIIPITPDVIEYVQVSGVIEYESIWNFSSLIVSFYFGSSLAKG